MYPAVGDIVLTGLKSQGATSHLIKFGALLAGYDKTARGFSHCAVVVGNTGEICEATNEGIVFSNISRFPEGDTVLIPMDVSVWDAKQLQDFCKACIGMEYGYGTFVAAGFNCLAAAFRLRGHGIYFGIGHTRICSVLVAEALARAGVIWDVDPSAIIPADIWNQFGHKSLPMASVYTGE